MARRHWLDPLARRLLIASGHLPSPRELTKRAQASEAAVRQAAHEASIEQDLQALKQARAQGLVDVNRATASDWLQLPGCSLEQADLLVRLQAGGVQLSGPEDLQRLLQLDSQTLRNWLPRLSFHWYGEPGPIALAPVAINQAGAAELRERLALSSQRLARLQLERARSPFRDLADVQARLQLPPTVVEAWIGRVSFDVVAPEAPPATGRNSTPQGPSLPPTRSRSAAAAKKRP